MNDPIPLGRAASIFLVCAVVGGCAATASTYPTVQDAYTPGIFLDLGAKATLPAGMSLRPVVAKGLTVTKESEGWRSRLYNDVARYCTIGYGHLIKRSPCDGSERVDWQDGISTAEGEALLVEDMADAQIAVMLAVTIKLTDTQYAALCDFVFNVGATNFRKSRLLVVVNAGQHDQVGNQLRRWVLAGGREIPGLYNRRLREIDLYYDGVLTPKAAPPTGEDMSPIDIRTGT
jgi:GH24 family phage-related lysozyme (muramidase)